MLTQLRRRASDFQRQQVQEALSLQMLDDPRALQAFSEEVPLTAQSLGLTRNVSYSELRQRYPEIVNKNNDPLKGLMQCDVCLSQISHPEEKNQIIYCLVCLSATHVKCHQRKLCYAYSQDMTDFICERCQYLVDNQPPGQQTEQTKKTDPLTGQSINVQTETELKQ